VSDWTPEVSMQIPGFVEPDELQWLHDQASRFKTILEVGCWMGRSASALAAGTTGWVWTVDHFHGSPSELDGAHAEAKTTSIRDEAERNLSPWKNVTVLAYTSLQAARILAPAEMVWIDGEHTREAALVDLTLWTPKATRLVCGHDRDWQGVSEALSIYGLPFECGPGAIWFVEKLRV
jgi:hypothetical protein